MTEDRIREALEEIQGMQERENKGNRGGGMGNREEKRGVRKALNA